MGNASDLVEVALGIDPGRTGAATALSMVRGDKGKGRVLDVLSWKESRRGGVRGYKVPGEWFRTISGLVDYMINAWVHEIEDDGPVVLSAVSVEGMALPDFHKRRKVGKPISEKSLITLIEETGAVVDAVNTEVSCPLYRPTATVWRGRVLRLGAYTRRSEAESYAIKSVPRLFNRGHGLHTIHEVESACMAMYTREALLTGNV